MEIELYSDEYFMREALKEAHKAAEGDEVPVGAVIVINNKVIARSHNSTELLNDFTAHAEMLAITAQKNADTAATSEAVAEFERDNALDAPKRGYTMVAKHNALHPKTKVRTGVLEEECSSILTDFFKEKR